MARRGRDGHVSDSHGIYVHGLHRGLVLIERAWSDELADAHDPIPTAAHAPGPSAFQVRGDPFSEPGRPLILTVASDCARLPPALLRDLLSLSRFPGVVVTLMPDIDPAGFAEPEFVEWFRDDQRLHVRVRAQQEASHDELLRRLEGPAPFPEFRRHRETWTWYDSSLETAAAHMFDVPADDARRTALEAVVHQALGHDYFVCPAATTARRDRRMRWPNEIGSCTVAEAFRLAGLKSRMYRSVPMLADPTGLASVNVGRWYDLTVMHFVPGLRRALAGALSPAATKPEAATADYLHAIRARLGELLIARDAIDRLTRREALGPRWVRPFDTGPVSGATGTDLTTTLAYHLGAALNSAFAATDNLALVAVARDSAGPERRDRGFAKLVGLVDSQWQSGEAASAVASAALDSADLPMVLAARAIRNSFVHREGVDFGSIEWHPEIEAPLRGLSGIWLVHPQVPDQRLRGGQECRPFHALVAAAHSSDPEFVILTFKAVVDALWCSVSGLLSHGLGSLSWSGADWTREGAIDGERLQLTRWWRTRLQRRLWGLEID